MKNQNIVYTYRYIWRDVNAPKDKFCVKYVTGAEIEHKNFMAKLLQEDSVVCASRIYVSEVNVSLTEQHEIIKKERKQ